MWRGAGGREGRGGGGGRGKEGEGEGEEGRGGVGGTVRLRVKRDENFDFRNLKSSSSRNPSMCVHACETTRYLEVLSLQVVNQHRGEEQMIDGNVEEALDLVCHRHGYAHIMHETRVGEKISRILTEVWL